MTQKSCKAMSKKDHSGVPQWLCRLRICIIFAVAVVTAVAQVPSLIWELSHAVGVAKKKKKKSSSKSIYPPESISPPAPRTGPGLKNHPKLPGPPEGQHKRATMMISPLQTPAAQLPGMASVLFLGSNFLPPQG